jgi:hypothetical protein
MNLIRSKVASSAQWMSSITTTVGRSDLANRSSMTLNTS